MPLVSGLERCPGCHPERSEGSGSPAEEILRCAQDDRPYLQMSGLEVITLTVDRTGLYDAVVFLTSKFEASNKIEGITFF